MAIGKRIVQRLNELNWDRKDLLDKVLNLTPQALSNLIRRDSKRSEWDEDIAAALGISVLDLVYGKLPSYLPLENVVQFTASEPGKMNKHFVELIGIAETMNERGVVELIGQARLLASIHPKAKANLAS